MVNTVDGWATGVAAAVARAGRLLHAVVESSSMGAGHTASRLLIDGNAADSADSTAPAASTKVYHAGLLLLPVLPQRLSAVSLLPCDSLLLLLHKAEGCQVGHTPLLGAISLGLERSLQLHQTAAAVADADAATASSTAAAFSS